MYIIGIIELYMGNQDKGFDIIEKGITDHNPYVYIMVDPKLDQFRSEPRFKELLKLYNLNN